MDPVLKNETQKLIQQAKSLMSTVSPCEQAMREAYHRFPSDQDIAILLVESEMDLRPWGYWMSDGQSHDGIAKAVEFTEQLLKIDLKHPGALHTHIH